MSTLAQPSKDLGGKGPLGIACADASRSTYRWWQTKTEVCFKVPLASNVKSREVIVKALPTRLEIRCPGPKNTTDELLVGPFGKKIKADDMSWTIEDSQEDGRHIMAYVVKSEVCEKWQCLIDADGHPRIDENQIAFFAEGMGTVSDLLA